MGSISFARSLATIARVHNSCKRLRRVPLCGEARRYPHRAAMDPHPQAPSVVAVVVACDPGEWLEETLPARGAQDYPSLSVLVLDAGGGADDPTARIAQVLPEAYVRRVEGNPGFGAAANEALAAVEGAA